MATDAAKAVAAPNQAVRSLAVRPSEWAVIAFVGYVVLRAGPGALSALTPTVVGRATLLVLVLVLVGEFVLMRRGLALAWPENTERLQHFFRLTLPLAVTPMVAGVALVLISAPNQSVTADSGRVFLVISAVVYAAALTSPLLALWLAVWVEVRTSGKVEAASFARSTALGLLDTARDWLPLVVMISGYSWMGAVMDLTPVQSADATLAGIDRAMFGVDPVAALQAIITPALSEYLAFAYSFYAVLFPLVFGALAVSGNRPAFRETSFAVCLGLALSYVSYTLVPARGPVLSQQFEVPLDLYFVGSIKEALMDASRITFDCFPSMHTALSLVFLAAIYRHARRLFWVLLPVVGVIPFACVYLRYHYVIDVLAGAVFALMLTAIARFVVRAPLLR
jgi:membrane-associated phospholipid phosphatase